MSSAEAAQAPIEVPEEPFLPEAALAAFSQCLAGVSCYLEYGSGGSTRLAARMGIPAIYSVESDAAFADAVSEAVQASDAAPGVRLTLTVADVGPTGAFGHPINTDKFRVWPDYPLAIWDRLTADRASPDLILIDGRFRVASFLASLINGRPGATILFDDYADRLPAYGVVERFVRPLRYADRMAIFQIPKRLPTRKIAAMLARYCINPR